MGQVTFLGACGTVTGSCTLLELGGTRLLVDCGLYQGDEELEQRNWRPFPFRPQDIDAVVLTHAHLDHTGLLPRLAAQGYGGSGEMGAKLGDVLKKKGKKQRRKQDEDDDDEE